jgi:hypothetical protein
MDGNPGAPQGYGAWREEHDMHELQIRNRTHRANRASRVALIVLALLLAGAGLAAAEERIQLAILLDTSNSMDGLIGQAKSQLWKVVNELARAKRNGKTPALEVALFEYGNDGLSGSEGYIRMVSDLTTDLDKISEELFKLTTDGGSEYCGMVIDRAAEKLSWSRARDVLKVIYIAGNEPFTQGPVPYAASCARAIRKGIVVNTIFCGPFDEGVATFWKDGADRADGRYMSIDQDEAIVAIDTPFDKDIVSLGNELNQTYAGYGSKGEALKSRQAAQDSNAAGMGGEATVQRSVAKAQGAYTNSGWDLVDAVKGKEVSLGALKDEELPLEMRKMSLAEKEHYVQDLTKRRAELQSKINLANEKRRVFIAAATKNNSAQSTLDVAILTSVKDQAAKLGFSIK